jgi:HEAT repeat protein
MCRRLALAGLDDDHPATRVAAIQLLLRPARKQDEMLAPIVPLLRDAEAPVRRAAVIALGTAKDVVSEDDLLPLLHDPDQEVQAACALALRSRGLEENHLLLARLISDDQPGARLQVLQHLGQARDLEPGVWLRRLTQDPAPAVRAAAIRAAAAQGQTDLRERLREMASGDPSPTVRQLAGHYLERMPR